MNIRENFQTVIRWLIFVGLLYLFLVAVQLLQMSIKIAGGDLTKQLFESLDNPFAGLAVGVLVTVLVQSSSVTTTLIVGLVGTGELSVAMAIPMVMGANIGTSITNTLVSLGSVTRSDEFRRAFAGATVHDFFNFLTVLILLPAELITKAIFGVGFLEQGARSLAAVLPVGGGGKFNSPVKNAVKWLAKKLQALFEHGLGMEDNWLAIALLVVSLLLIMAALWLITKNMKVLMANRIEVWLNRVLLRSGVLGIGIGIVMTVLVQSSSITTSLMVPMFGAGVLTLEAGFPVMLGANIGTTVTALLAALVTGQEGLVIALVHLLFNLCGTLMFFPFKPMRRIPIALSLALANQAAQNRAWVAVYILVVFIGLPLLGIAIWK